MFGAVRLDRNASCSACHQRPMTPDPSNDRAHNLVELRRLADKFDGPSVSQADVEAMLRNDADALTFRARLRRSGMSDAEVTAALFGPSHPDA
ncbi:hypothetical protein tb265_20110 [Gemmatimonadetes bacterium T265]|nr:hypothetical protein tb265_20110 [Gemmatimonadetes bacterium T265]